MRSRKYLDTYMKDSKNTLFLGIPIAQWHADLWLWEKFFSTHRIKSLIEFGTGSGGLSLFFLLQSMQHHFRFNSFDIARPAALDEPIGKVLNLKSHFTQGDIMVKLHNVIVELITKSEHPILLYCDNGNKPLEVKTYTTYLLKDDFVAVHDWGVEFTRKNVPISLELIPFREVTVIDSYTRWMRKTK